MITVAYLGPEHTNTHVAAQKKFGRRVKYVHAPTIESVIWLVYARRAKYGVIPVENSLQGAVTHTLDYFVHTPGSRIRIQGEIEQPIHHYLITLGKTTSGELRRIKGVSSHPQALAQCHEWLKRHLPSASYHETNSTAEAVAELVRRGGAAIGPVGLAQHYGLPAIPIRLRQENKTRFLILGLGQPQRGKRNKTSIVFGLKDHSGALYDALAPFKHEGINLTKIESRPSKRRAWEYYFFIDVEGHQADSKLQRALKVLKSSTSLLRVLGSYPVTH